MVVRNNANSWRRFKKYKLKKKYEMDQNQLEIQSLFANNENNDSIQ